MTKGGSDMGVKTEELFHYWTSEKMPIYSADYRVRNHRECPLIAISEAFDNEFNLEVLSCGDEKGNQKTRFQISEPFSRSTIRKVFDPLFKSKQVKYVEAWSGGLNTIFFVSLKEGILKASAEIATRPLGDIGNFTVYPESESFTLYCPGKKGKDELFSLLDTYRELGESARIRNLRREESIDFAQLSLDIFRRTTPIALRPEDLFILEAAMRSGYFEDPKEAYTRDLAEKLDMPKSTLNKKLRRINRILVDYTLKMMKSEL